MGGESAIFAHFIDKTATFIVQKLPFCLTIRAVSEAETVCSQRQKCPDKGVFWPFQKNSC